uniref:SRCR domain-containing protein n=1 Tax=Scleropages formosus TaxID=113540 RepID=A0A8C9SUJ8_SCLFO
MAIGDNVFTHRSFTKCSHSYFSLQHFMVNFPPLSYYFIITDFVRLVGGADRCSGRVELKVCCCRLITSLFPGPDDLRLVNGSSPCSGTVEVKFNQSWATVCDADFDWQDAQVVCRELDCGNPSALLKVSHFGQGEGPIWSKNFQCEGHESFLHECLTTDRPDCAHDKDVGLVCSGLRLMNGPDRCSGRVQLRYSGKWGTVCNESWDMRASDVLCHQLKCGHAVGQAWFGEGSGQIWPDVFQCHRNETRLSQCAVSPWSRAACSHGQDVGVICSVFRNGGSSGDLQLSTNTHLQTQRPGVHKLHQ